MSTPNRPERKSTLSPMQVGLWAGACLLLAALGVGAPLTLHYEYRAEVDEILRLAEQAAQKLASRTAEAFDHVNQTTLLIKFLSERGDPFSLPVLDEAGVLSRNLTRSVLITDTRGSVKDTTSGEVAMNIADEDDFKRLRRMEDPGLLIGLPAKNPLTDEWSIPVSRSVVKAGGGFGGIITASLDPATLAASYSRSEARNTAIGILGRDGIYRARSVGGSVTFGERVNVATLERRAVEIRTRRAPVVSPVDGVARFVVVVNVEHYPLMAVVAVDADSALAGYQHTKKLVLAWSTALAMLIVGAALGLLVQARRLDRSRAATARSERAFRATIEGSLDAVTILRAERDPSGLLLDLTVLDVNVRGAAHLFKSRLEAIGRRLFELAPTLRTAGLLPCFEEAIRTRRVQSAEVQTTDPRMSTRWLHHRVVPLDDGVALITRDITEQKEAEKALDALARYDPLTQLWNRRHFEESLQAARGRALRSGETLALVYIDLDGFKKVNDTYGHEGGDLLLIEVARRLLDCVRSTDIVSRLGGDEFAIILERAGTEMQIRETCDRILRSLAADHTIDGHPVRTPPSIGAVLLAGDETCATLLRRADESMYAAKRAGKARFCLVGNEAAAVDNERTGGVAVGPVRETLPVSA